MFLPAPVHTLDPKSPWANMQSEHICILSCLPTSSPSSNRFPQERRTCCRMHPPLQKFNLGHPNHLLQKQIFMRASNPHPRWHACTSTINKHKLSFLEVRNPPNTTHRRVPRTVRRATEERLAPRARIHLWFLDRSQSSEPRHAE